MISFDASKVHVFRDQSGTHSGRSVVLLGKTQNSKSKSQEGLTLRS
jgi:hypothetical protein